MNLSVSETQSTGEATRLRKLSRYETALAAIFLLTLPLCNPWVRGDGVGYYAFAREISKRISTLLPANWITIFQWALRFCGHPFS
jgi:hypothetical protein